MMKDELFSSRKKSLESFGYNDFERTNTKRILKDFV